MYNEAQMRKQSLEIEDSCSHVHYHIHIIVRLAQL